jgi:hypothetical protein
MARGVAGAEWILHMTPEYLGRRHGMDVFTAQEPAPGGLLLMPDPLAAMEQQVMKEAMRVLMDEYPGYGWMIRADARQGILTVALPHFMGHVLQYVIHIDQVASAEAMDKAITEAGGHILERLKLNRSGVHQAEYADAAAKLPKVQKHVRNLPE